jgi:hypothetical protein
MDSPNDYLLFNLLCTLNHLRDWFHPSGEKAYKGKAEQDYIKEERFHAELSDDADYEVVRKLCNSAKHFHDRGIGRRTNSFCGFSAGFSGAGDRLGQHNYTIDGEDIRLVMARIFNKYKVHFDGK